MYRREHKSTNLDNSQIWEERWDRFPRILFANLRLMIPRGNYSGMFQKQKSGGNLPKISCDCRPSQYWTQASGSVRFTVFRDRINWNDRNLACFAGNLLELCWHWEQLQYISTRFSSNSKYLDHRYRYSDPEIGPIKLALNLQGHRAKN